jgi:hypothetical protein
MAALAEALANSIDTLAFKNWFLEDALSSEWMSPKEKAAMKKWYMKLAVKLRIIVVQRCVDEGEENNFEDFVKSYFKLNCREHLRKIGRQIWERRCIFGRTRMPPQWMYIFARDRLA